MCTSTVIYVEYIRDVYESRHEMVDSEVKE